MPLRPLVSLGINFQGTSALPLVNYCVTHNWALQGFSLGWKAVNTIRAIGDVPKWSKSLIEFSEFRKSEKSLKYEFLSLNSLKTFRKNSIVFLKFDQCPQDLQSLGALTFKEYWLLYVLTITHLPFQNKSSIIYKNARELKPASCTYFPKYCLLKVIWLEFYHTTGGEFPTFTLCTLIKSSQILK